jgi:hypothetical protein
MYVWVLPTRLYRCIVRYGNLHGYVNLAAPKPPPLPDFPPSANKHVDRNMIDTEFNVLRKEAIVHFCTPVLGARSNVAVAVAPGSGASTPMSGPSSAHSSPRGHTPGAGLTLGVPLASGLGSNDLQPVSPSALMGGGGMDLLDSSQVASMGLMDELNSDDGEDDPSQPSGESEHHSNRPLFFLPSLARLVAPNMVAHAPLRLLLTPFPTYLPPSSRPTQPLLLATRFPQA